ncbi:MAG TPA: CpsB/CapC family capsule biosynthesis tyrosine phosphatase [Thermoleophilaceae bacterium]
MIDLHCHLLPGIDDGAADMRDALAMARQGEEDGIELVCATPHIRHDHDVRIHELPARVEEVNRELERAGLRVRAATGGEVAETALPGLDDRELRAVSLGGGGRWLLIEPAPGPLEASLVRHVGALHSRGFSCVIAHPERHPGGLFEERLIDLCESGALIQLTADALVAGEAADFLLELAGRGLAHLLGSDAHSSRFGRPLRLSEGLARLEGVERVRGHIHWIAREAPAAIVRGEEVRPPYPAG